MSGISIIAVKSVEVNAPKSISYTGIYFDELKKHLKP